MARAFIIRMQMDPLPGGEGPVTDWIARVRSPEKARHLAARRAGGQGWWVKEIVEAPAGTIEQLRLVRGEIADYPEINEGATGLLPALRRTSAERLKMAP
jgi:hypothetical protein